MQANLKQAEFTRPLKNEPTDGSGKERAGGFYWILAALLLSLGWWIDVSHAQDSVGFPPAAERLLGVQLALVRRGISPGPLDGVAGLQTSTALRAFQQKENLPVNGELDAATLQRLGLGPALYTNYVVVDADLERLQPLGKTWLGKSQQDRLDYETVLELVSEKSQANPKLIRRLNPDLNWSNVIAGTSIKVPMVECPPVREKAAFLKIFLSARVLEAFDEDTNLLAHFPCSIAQRVEKRPVGELHVAVVAPDPNYTFDPEVFPESAEARELGRKLILQPGPNNPVGTVWIGLDKPGYGIHGTPKPEEVGRTESHGCFRLANWNVEYLLKLIGLGTVVWVEP
jgi:lipoprotein-anchoring transpeptidase ErfK/SrfK